MMILKIAAAALRLAITMMKIVQESLEDMLTCTIRNLCLPSDILIIFKFFNFLNQCAIKALQLYYAEVN